MALISGEIPPSKTELYLNAKAAKLCERTELCTEHVARWFVTASVCLLCPSYVCLLCRSLAVSKATRAASTYSHRWQLRHLDNKVL